MGIAANLPMFEHCNDPFNELLMYNIENETNVVLQDVGTL